MTDAPAGRRLSVLSAADADRLRELPFTYPTPGCTAGDVAPAGLRLLRVRHRLPPEADLDLAAVALFGWGPQRSVGRVAASSPVVRQGAVALLRLGVGPLRITAPVRVVDVVHGPTTRGWAYGSLPGHPETGEERFQLDLDTASGRLVLTVTAMSREATWWMRAAAPLARSVQRAAAHRYARSADRAALPGR
ncbi:DUF1990 family protein [Nakamurella endophytica]|uniref:DUF1990 domain-containing protein n=1 Tax=Nakamurella endophytica TaxID=1748367 RepID=A0A917SY60_9ACTN|nr:DUF1990 domain-containing protein [Nakamurella endophytica]GGM02171.1 hypothetical protein GCM10011594_22820 [Nakamurella endophytica]